jgi:hypothetical protein
MDHVGWRSKSSFERYSRIKQLIDASTVSSLYAKVADSGSAEVGEIFEKFDDPLHFPQAF